MISFNCCFFVFKNRLTKTVIQVYRENSRGSVGAQGGEGENTEVFFLEMNSLKTLDTGCVEESHIQLHKCFNCW